MPKTRTTHVRRIKNADNEEVWIDVERVDKIVNKQEGQGGLYRLTTRMMFWGDETDDAAHPTRGMTELRVEKPEDPDTFVNINVIDKQKTRRGQGPDYKKKHKWFSNLKEDNTAREVSFRRVYHWDTETDPNDDGGTEYVRIEGTEDRSQYVDVAVIEKLIQRRGQGPSYKKRTYQFNTDPIKEFSEPSPDGVDPATVVWLDPWQNIINVQWKNVEFVTFTISLEEIWENTDEYRLRGDTLCSPSNGFTGLEHSSWYLIKFGVIADGGEGPASSVGKYINGEFLTGGPAEISGLEYPFPKEVEVPPWLFLGITGFGLPIHRFRLEWLPAEGDVILDRSGNPVTFFGSDFPFRRADQATYTAFGIAFTSGPQCWSLFGGPGGTGPRIIAFTEDHGPNEFPSEITQASESISISSIEVVFEGETFRGAGYIATGTRLDIICERVPD